MSEELVKKSNELLEEILLDALQKTKSGVEKAVDFAVEQAPDVVNQLLTWKAIESGLWFALGIFITCAVIVIVCKFYALFKKTKDGDMLGASLFSALIGGLVSIGILGHNLEWLKIIVAPKLYLIEYAAALVK